MNYQYILKDHKGAKVEGIIKADSLDQAMEKLMKEGGTIITIKVVGSSIRGNLSYFDKLMLVFYKWRSNIPLRVLVFFTRQLSTMFSAGLTIEKAISGLQKDEKHKRFNGVLKTIADDIRKGFSLSEAMSQHPGVFNSLYLALVKAGEVSGSLHIILNELSEYLEKIEDTRRKVQTALVYPIFILIFLSCVVWVMFYFLIPMFNDIYTQYGSNLPLATQTAVLISDFINENFLQTFIMLILFILSVFLINLSDRGRYFFDSLKINIPIIGRLVTNSIMSKFSRTFSILISAGVPIMDALELSENVTQNAVVEKAIKQTRAMIKEGYSIASAFRKTGVFPSTLLQLTATGEETGEMDSLLTKAAEFYEKLVDSVVSRLTSLVEPLLIIIMGSVVGSVVIVIYLPIFSLGLAVGAGY